jgi:prepilin-type N-terminal cleavage/methylation domain-containing protein
MNSKKNNKGFTLAEVLIVIGIVAVALTAMIQLYIYTSMQAKVAAEKTLALAEVQNTIENIRNHPFEDITIDYASGGSPGDVLSLDSLTGFSYIYVNSSTADIMTIDIPVCWRSIMNRVIGEDQNLNGVLDVGEDTDSDGKIGSPVTLSTIITDK